MVAGALGMVLSLRFWSSFSPYRRGDTVVGGDTVVEERHVRATSPSRGFTYAGAVRLARAGGPSTTACEMSPRGPAKLADVGVVSLAGDPS